MRARQITLPNSASGMKVRSAGVILPRTCSSTVRKYLKKVGMLKNLRIDPTMEIGRGKAISASRPTMIVSLWWRAWLQRQTTASRITMNEAIS